MVVVHVPGKRSHKIMLFALSTCGWCQKTKRLLDDLGLEYDYEYVDQLQGEERTQAIKEVTSWNPDRSFPVIVIDDNTPVIGYNEPEIRKVLEN